MGLGCLVSFKVHGLGSRVWGLRGSGCKNSGLSGCRARGGGSGLLGALGGVLGG